MKKKTDEGYMSHLENELRQRNAELEKNRELLQATLDSSLDMVQVFEAVRDEKGKIIDFIWVLNNYTSETYYGDVIGQSLLKNNPGVVHTGIFNSFVEVTETGIPQQYEKHYVNEQFDGWFYQSVVKLNDGVATSTSDITARKLADDRINALNKELSQKNRELESLNSELTTFNNIAANDYRETLQSLYMYLEFIIKTDAPNISNAGKANIRKAQGAIQKLKLLTEDIVSFSRIPAMDSNLTSVDLEELLNALLSDMAQKISEKEAIITRSGILPAITGYPLLLSLLFYHLIDNALKFLPKGKNPEIKISSSVCPEGACKGMYEICIEDNGIGFDQNQAENLFAIFFRLHDRSIYKGSGIGLAVCKKIMDLHNGHIVAISDGNGAVFKCYFPV
ncbi:sensor histidine kinase [Flavobacterium lindanitolerans]|uniref:sensor histidine kinase n=1 Tax=Flavobacterium lindanitolerans TaxID=428988 RepID=UPI0031D71A28